MARTKNAYGIARYAAEQLIVQSWSRGRSPIERPLFHQYDWNIGGWEDSLFMLVGAPGFRKVVAGRNTEDVEEILVIAEWANIESLNAFAASPGYDAYLDAFDIERGSLNALFVLEPSPSTVYLSYENEIMTTTVSFEHPIDRESCDAFAHARYLPRSFGPGRWGHEAWMSKPQLFEGRLVDNAVLVQQDAGYAEEGLTLSPSGPQDISKIQPIRVEEVVWEFVCAEPAYEDRWGIKNETPTCNAQNLLSKGQLDFIRFLVRNDLL